MSFGLQNIKRKSRWCFIFMLYTCIYILAVGVGEPNLTFREILKLITPDNYCKTRSAAQKYNPRVNVNVESTCVDGGSFRNLNFSREQKNPSDASGRNRGFPTVKVLQNYK